MAATAGLTAAASLYLQYAARIPPFSPRFQWPCHRDLLASQSTLDAILFEHSPPGESTDEYDRSFLKHLVKHIDTAIEHGTDEDAAWLNIAKQDWAVDDALLERYVALVSMPDSTAILGAPAPKPILSRHYFPLPTTAQPPHPLLGPCGSVVFREEGMAISQGTTGLKTWEASLRLAAYLVSTGLLSGETDARILELGSGAGFLGLVCAQLISCLSHGSLYLTDLEGQVLDRLRETASLSAYTVG